ncbi:hypothetical protein [Geminocystis sp.]|uniref:hypothetical protein n=1 Tax=Geminocystis sp. TaxID=2664100 RepID=UPI003593E827
MAQKKAPKPPTPSKEASLETSSPERLRELAHQDLKLARVVAKNIIAPPDLLAELAHSQDQSTRKAVVSNPNTPKETLLELGSQFPEELLDNPIFDLLLLENPNLLADMPTSTLKSMVKRETVPRAFLDWAVNHGDDEVLIALLRNPQLSKEHLTKLTEHKNTQIVEEAKFHVNWDKEIENPEEFIRQALRKNDLTIPQGKEKIISNLFTEMISPQWVYDFLVSTNGDVCNQVASNSNTPVSLLEKLATDSDRWIRSYVAKNPNTPVTSLENLAIDSDSNVRYRVVSNPNITKQIKEKVLLFNEYYTTHKFPTDILKQLAVDSRTSVRSYVASNQNTPVVLLEKLATDSDSGVCRDVAENPNTPVVILEKLATDSDSGVRYEVAGNPNTPVIILEKLATDSDSGVRYEVAENPNTPVVILEKLASDSDVCINVASNPNTPITLLEKLATDSDRWIRSYVAKNPNTPVSILEKLATDSDSDVRINVAKNPNTPVNLKIEMFNSLAKGTTPNLGRLAVFLSPYAETSHLAKNFRSTSWLERWAIAQNPNTPDNTLSYLVQDGNRLVRSAAELNIKQRQEQK